jgi:hypothetical protein
MAFCTQCGTQAALGQRFCVVCGTALLVDTSIVSSAPDSGATTSWTTAPPLGAENAATSTPLVEFFIAAEPVKQSRWSIFFRLILALPLFIWAACLGYAAAFAVFCGWFAALFTGRLPDGIQEFVTDVLKYSAEVTAYASVLTPRWPGLTLHPGDKAQVDLHIGHYPLNRAAVFFRIILTIPAFILYAIVGYGIYPLTVVVWCSALILGRPAKPLYGALTLSMRYTNRQLAYFGLLTPTQPFSGFFGDRVAPGPAPAAVVDGSAPSSVAASRLSGQRVLSTWARIFFATSLVLGVVIGIGYGVFSVPPKNADNFNGDINNTAVSPLVTSVNQSVVHDVTIFNQSAKICEAEGNGVCDINAALTATNAIVLQIGQLNSMLSYLSGGLTQYNQYIADVTRVNADVYKVATVDSVAEQESMITDDLNPDVSIMEVQYQKLHAAL